jgi:transposase
VTVALHSTAPEPDAPWLVPDDLWKRIEPLLPLVRRRMGRKRLPDRPALEGIRFVLHTGIAWRQLPTELGFGSGFTCWRRLVEWQERGVWDELQALLVARLPHADRFEWSRAAVPAEQRHAKTRRRARARIKSDSP